MILSRPDHRHRGILGELKLSDSWNLGLMNEWNTDKGIIVVICGNKYMHYRNLYLLRHVCNNTVILCMFLF